MQHGHRRITARAMARPMRGTSIRIIGIDPGLRRTGWGVVESDGVRLSYVASGVITSPADHELAYRLRELFEGIASVIASFKPHEAAVEETFVNENARATLKLGQARGMALLAPAMGGLTRRRVSAQPDQEVGRRRRPRGEAPDRGHDRLPVAEGARRQARTRPMRWRSPSAMRTIGRRECGWRRQRAGSEAKHHDRQAQGQDRRDRRELLPSSTSTASATRCRPPRARCAT